MGILGADSVDYRPTVLARLLHTLPHLNVSLHKVNSTFAPQSDVYLESLGILASIPAAWLILTLAILLLYLATRCCDRRSNRRKVRSLTAPRLALAGAAFLCAAATGLGLYANDDLHNGLVQILTSTRKLNSMISEVRDKTKIISVSLNEVVSPQLTELSDIFESPVNNQTALVLLLSALQTVRQNNTLAMRAAADIQRPLANLNMNPYTDLGDKWELYRWAGAMGILSGLLALCAVILVGAARRSRRCLVLASVLALISASVAWLLASIGLAAAVALADFCIAPDQFAASVVSQKGFPPELLHYYTHCDSSRINPFTQRLRESQQAVTRMRLGLGSVTRLSLDLFKNKDLQPKLSALTTEINTCDRSLASLAFFLECKTAYVQWTSGIRGLCVAALPGLALLLLSTAIAGLLLSILVCLASHTWIYLRKRRDYSQVDEADPFLPAPAASQAVAARTLQTGIGAGTLPRGPPHHHRSQGSYNRDNSTLPRNSDPPPSYAAALLHEQKEKISRKGAVSPVHAAPQFGAAAVLAPSAPSPYQYFNDLDGCDTNRHGPEHRITSGSHLSHLSGSHSHHRGGHATLGRLPSHASHHDHHINLSGPNNAPVCAQDNPPPPDLTSKHQRKHHHQHQHQHANNSTSSMTLAAECDQTKYDTMKSKSGTLRSTKSSASNYSDYNSEDPTKPTKTDLLTSKARGSVYNSTVGISSSFGPRIEDPSLPPATKPIERTATLQKYNTLGRRPLPLTPDEIKQSKETPIPRVPDEMPLSAANLNQYRSLQRTGRGPYGSHFNSLYRIQQGKPIAAHPPQIPQMHQQQLHQQQQGQDKNSQHPTQEPVYSNNESERQLYAVTEL